MDKIDLDQIIINIGKKPNQSYIIVLDENSLVDKIITKLKNQLQIKSADLLVISAKEETLKISQIRLIQKKLALKPEGNLNLVCLVGAESLTLEAANSLLKILEEPSSHSLIMLFCKNAKKLLSTITSRCVKITIRNSKQEINSEYVQILTDLLRSQKLYQKFGQIDKILTQEINIEKLLTTWLLYLRNATEIYINQELSKKIYQYLQKYSPKINQKLFLENLIICITNNEIKSIN